MVQTYLDPCLHSHGPIDLVVLMLGTNDLKIRFQATPTDIGKGIDRLIKMIIDHSTEETRWTIRKDPFNGTTASWDDLTEIPSGEEMGFERGISYSKRLAPIYEDWAKFHNIEFLDAAKYAKASEIDACHLTRESHRKLGEMVDEKCKEILEI